MTRWEDAFCWLTTEGYFVVNGFGWAAPAKVPSKKHLAAYVHAIKTLGAWSVGDNSPVEVTCGVEQFDLMFRLRGKQ